MLPNKILADITHYLKYAKYLPDLQRRETFEETITRNKNMHIKKFPHLTKTIEEVYQKFVYTKKLLPAMRSLQFGGEAIEKNNTRMFNCSFQLIDHYKAFSETMFLLLSGTGKGYSVQEQHVAQLPEITIPQNKKEFIISDDINGWGEAIDEVMRAFLGESDYLPVFNYSKIRDKGMRLITSGGRAPGPEPLKICLENIIKVFEELIKKEQKKLRPIDCHSILCYIAEAVLSGGIRRAAMIALFSFSDKEMLYCKTGNWYENNIHFSRANNSVVALYSTFTYEMFMEFWEVVKNSGAGEPGIYWTHDLNLGTNPCGEASLRSKTFCNLVEGNVQLVNSQTEFNDLCAGGSFVNTLQASYTDFPFLREEWRKRTEEDALLGFGLTGIASGNLDNIDLAQGANIVVSTNEQTAKAIGINQAARSCLVKPAGTSSIILETSSGVHDWEDEYYIRRIRINKNEEIYSYLIYKFPELVEDDVTNKNQAVVSFPQMAPENALLKKDSTAINLLNRTKRFNKEWIRPSHVSGENFHNVSATIPVKDSEWDRVGAWMWINRYEYHGLTVLPFSDHTYQQAPFEACSKEVFQNLYSKLKEIDLTEITETDDNTNMTEVVACSGGVCSLI